MIIKSSQTNSEIINMPRQENSSKLIIYAAAYAKGTNKIPLSLRRDCYYVLGLSDEEEILFELKSKVLRPEYLAFASKEIAELIKIIFSNPKYSVTNGALPNSRGLQIGEIEPDLFQRFKKGIEDYLKGVNHAY